MSVLTDLHVLDSNESNLTTFGGTLKLLRMQFDFNFLQNASKLGDIHHKFLNSSKLGSVKAILQIKIMLMNRNVIRNFELGKHRP